MEDTQGTQPAQAPVLEQWKTPDGRLVIECAPEVAEGLLVEALGGLGLLSRGRGVETGGILLGWTRRQGETRWVRIEDFRPVPCVHALGPGYLLSEAEQAELRQIAAARAARSGRRQYLVGYWRSHTRGELSLRPEELGLLTDLRRYGCEIAVLIEPRGAGPGVAAVFAPEEGSFRPGPPAAMFPVGPVRRRPGHRATERSRKPAGPSDSADAGVPEAPAVEEVAPPVPEFRFTLFDSGAGHQPQPRTRKGRWIIAALLALVGLGGAGAYAVSRGYVRIPSPEWLPWGAPKDPYGLGLRVEKVGENLRVEWDATSPAIRKAEKAILVIADGDRMRVAELDRGHLQSGNAVYRPLGDWVSFRIELRWGRQSLSEAVEWEADFGGESGARGERKESASSSRR
jgi:hypothetical protein